MTAVHDGDTLTLTTGTKIRLFGIDAPELNQRCERNGACLPCGHEARDTLKAMAIGELICERRGKSYNRVVARCAVGDKDLALEMIRAGHATVYGRYIKQRDPIRAMYMDAEARSKDAKLGMWADDFIPMEDWRRHGARLMCER